MLAREAAWFNEDRQTWAKWPHSKGNKRTIQYCSIQHTVLVWKLSKECWCKTVFVSHAKNIDLFYPTITYLCFILFQIVFAWLDDIGWSLMASRLLWILQTLVREPFSGSSFVTQMLLGELAVRLSGCFMNQDQPSCTMLYHVVPFQHHGTRSRYLVMSHVCDNVTIIKFCPPGDVMGWLGQDPTLGSCAVCFSVWFHLGAATLIYADVDLLRCKHTVTFLSGHLPSRGEEPLVISLPFESR